MLISYKVCDRCETKLKEDNEWICNYFIEKSNPYNNVDLCHSCQSDLDDFMDNKLMAVKTDLYE